MIFFFLAVMLTVMVFSAPVVAEAPQPQGRYGLGLPWEYPVSNFADLRKGGVCQIYNWGVANPEMAAAANQNGLIYYPMIWPCQLNSYLRLEQPKGMPPMSDIQRFAVRFPGATWFIFNEPDYVYQGNCGDPKTAIATYKRATEYILSFDSLAKFACCGEGFTAGFDTYGWTRRFYEEYLLAYGGPPRIDFIHMHLYDSEPPFGPGNINAGAMKEKFRRWYELKSSNYWAKNLPIYVSEYGPLMSNVYPTTSPIPPDQLSSKTSEIAAYAIEMTEFLKSYSDIKGFFWFSSYYGAFNRGDGPSNVCVASSCLPTACPAGLPQCAGVQVLTSVGASYLSLAPKVNEIVPLLWPTFVCPACSSGLTKNLGNANCDAKINGLDFGLWAKGDAAADFNCQTGQTSPVVDVADFYLWLVNYGRT